MGQTLGCHCTSSGQTVEACEDVGAYGYTSSIEKQAEQKLVNIADLIHILQEVPFFPYLPADQHGALANALTKAGCKNVGTLVRRSLNVILAKCVSSAESSFTVERICHKDISRVALLGCGAHGTVHLVQHDVTKKHYALKSVNKGYITLTRDQKTVMSEKTTQMLCSSPFIVKLHETFNEYENLFFLSELMLGGELRTAYNRHGLFGSTAHCQYYVASAVYALQHMHERDIIFRDLKPENMLLSTTGRMKVTDFGLAKISAGKTYTKCGTSAYCAPEMVAGTGYTRAVDWWALGLVTFELMMGFRPFAAFESSSTSRVGMKLFFSVIQKDMDKEVFAGMPGNCETFVRDLTTLSPSDRIPMKDGGTDNIVKHKWFKEFQWAALLDETCEPPYKPCIASDTDLSNFDCAEDRLPPKLAYKDYDDGSMWDAEFATSE